MTDCRRAALDTKIALNIKLSLFRLLVDPPGAISARLKMANGMGWIDAPVSGGSVGAEEGTLAVMAGGDAADIERVRPYVLAMARRLTHMGPTGAGQSTKLCNQVIVGCAMATSRKRRAWP